ncbi:transposable element Tcb2 transposase [Trichonephila clavipes]|nr:transposable element Tcb2 transposase [Trichonephila clavipes]
MDWPAYLPDLNPIEHLWGDLGRRFAVRLHHPENTQQLRQILIDKWALLPQEMFHQLVLSMRRRCEATIANFTAVLVAVKIPCMVELGSSMMRNPIPDHNCRRSSRIPFKNTLWKKLFTKIASDKNVHVMVPKVYSEVVRKRRLLLISMEVHITLCLRH